MNGWERLKDLQKRATGGANVAAEPGDASRDIWFAGPRPAGMDEAAAWFLREVQDNATTSALFFVGGPGAGKSHAAAEIVSNLTQIDPYDDGLAHRKYKYSAGVTEVVLVNDATIRSSEKSAELYSDLTGAIKERHHILACVNRGVLVEEISASRENNIEITPAKILIDWLHSTGQFSENSEHDQFRVEVSSQDYISSAKIFLGKEAIAQAMAVYVDECSMMEPAPKIEISQNEASECSLQAGPYEVTQFNERNLLDLSTLPAGESVRLIIQDIVDHFGSDLSGEDPISANLLTLSAPVAQSGLLSILRASEIVNGQILTYRDLWGALARCIIGDLTDALTAEESVVDFSDFDPYARSDFEEIKRLASLRFSQSLFESKYFGGTSNSTQNHPILRLTRMVDPLRDSKSTIDVAHSTKVHISQSIGEAFSGHESTTTPLQYMLKREFREYSGLITNFDELVDTSYSSFIRKNSTETKRVREATAWYSRYLTRLFSTILGIPAFYDEISVWTNSWNLAPTIPKRLRNGLETLLVPNRDPEDSNSMRLMPVLDSRTIPIIGNLRSPKFAMAAEHIDLATTTKGEELFLELRERSKSVGSIALDFPLVREALAASTRYSGLTELSRVSSPRIERFRATRLANSSWDERQMVIAYGNSETGFVVKDRD